ncbi:MAG TPA: DUF4845 domain-containing protein [Steroidobacteraceae bacterium]|nr:DUF4845 domain-containing protein [Steroidobacteraceae bacterium]
MTGIREEHMRKQRGVTAIGWVFLLIPMALTIYAAIRIGPVYLNYWRIVDSMQKTATELKSDESLSPQTIRNSLAKRFDIGYVEKISSNDIDVSKGDKGWQMTVGYDGEAPLFANIKLVVAFDKTVVIN